MTSSNACTVTDGNVQQASQEDKNSISELLVTMQSREQRPKTRSIFHSS